MADMAISGEVPISPSIFRDHAMESKLKGAPINWVPMEAVPTNAGATTIIYQAPHPHAAVLMADFILEPGRTKNPGGFAIRQSGERLWLQTLVSGGGTQHGAIRQRSDEVAEGVEGARKKVRFKPSSRSNRSKSSENWAVDALGKIVSRQ